MSEAVLIGIIKELEREPSLEVRQRAFARLLEDFRTSPSVRKQLQADVCSATVLKRVRRYVKEEGVV